MGSYCSPMAFGLRYRFASPLNELSELSRPQGARQFRDTFISTDCGGSQPNAMGWSQTTHRACCRIKCISELAARSLYERV